MNRAEFVEYVVAVIDRQKLVLSQIEINRMERKYGQQVLHEMPIGQQKSFFQNLGLRPV